MYVKRTRAWQYDKIVCFTFSTLQKKQIGHTLSPSHHTHFEGESLDEGEKRDSEEKGIHKMVSSGGAPGQLGDPPFAHQLPWVTDWPTLFLCGFALKFKFGQLADPHFAHSLSPVDTVLRMPISEELFTYSSARC